MAWRWQPTQRRYPELLVVRRTVKCEDGTAIWSIWSPDTRGGTATLLPTYRRGYGECSAKALAYSPLFRGRRHTLWPDRVRVPPDSEWEMYDWDRPVRQEWPVEPNRGDTRWGDQRWGDQR